MAKEYPSAILVLVLAAMLLPGCTINPQDLSRQGALSTGGAQAPGTSGTAGTSGIQQPAGISLTLEEVAKHNTASDCWMIIRDVVLNLTSFSSHPGGSAYLPYCGRDGTVAYESVPHSVNADSWFQYYRIGTLGQELQPNTSPPPPSLRGGGDEYEDDDDD